MDFLTPELTSQLFDISLMVLTALVTGVVIPIIRKLGTLAALWLESKTHSAAFACGTEKLTTLVAEAMKDTQENFVKEMKKTGKWGPEAAAAAREAVYDAVLRSLGPEGSAEVMQCLKLDEEGLAQRVYQMLEVQVSDSKNKQ